MKIGWTRNKTHYHFFDGKSDVSLCSLVSHPWFMSPQDLHRSKKFYLNHANLTNISITLLCVKCKIKFDNIPQEKPQIPKWKLKPVTCSENGCGENGVAYVSTMYSEKPHYCITHNVLVQEQMSKR